MRRIIGVIFVLSLASGPLFAQDLTEDDYKTIDQTKTKLVRMKKEMDKFVKELSAAYSDTSKDETPLFGQDVKVDIATNDKDFTVKADLPGMSKDKIEVTLEGKTLKIAGFRDIQKKETEPGIVRQERMQGRFERIVELPGEGESSGVKASYKDGVLEVSIPKKRILQEAPVKIDVQ